MKNKKVLILGVALVFLALVAGVVFAQGRLGTLDGVTWATIEGKSSRLPSQSTTHYTQVYNENDYAVRVDLSRLHNDDVLHSGVQFAAKETKDFGGGLYVSRVRR
jgi:hypothetical protein